MLSPHCWVALLPRVADCNTFDYDKGFGVYLKHTSSVTIEHASANADDTGGFILDNSTYVDIGKRLLFNNVIGLPRTPCP